MFAGRATCPTCLTPANRRKRCGIRSLQDRVQIAFAPRHADAGVALDVLAELMSHELLSSTQAYYQVGEKRRRAAVDRLANHEFDRHGHPGLARRPGFARP